MAAREGVQILTNLYFLRVTQIKYFYKSESEIIRGTRVAVVVREVNAAPR